MRREALSIGVDAGSSFGYGRRLRVLGAAVADARALARIAGERDYATTVLENEGASTGAVAAALRAASRLLVRGDTFLLAFNGHGLAGDAPSGFQQSWCLYDGPLCRFGEDGLDAALARFAAGVRVLVLANCCHSGIAAGATVPTPEIRAHVVRISACAAAAGAFDTVGGSSLSPFAASFVNACSTSGSEGIFDLFDRIARTTVPRPQLEIGRPRSEAFLREGF